MTNFFSSGRVVDGVLAFMLIELIVLVSIRKRGKALFRPLDIIVNCGAGAALLLALRAALRGSPWQTLPVWLLVALGFHVWDLTRRAARRTG